MGQANPGIYRGFLLVPFAQCGVAALGSVPRHNSAGHGSGM